jgi:hypothetical protein
MVCLKKQSESFIGMKVKTQPVMLTWQCSKFDDLMSYKEEYKKMKTSLVANYVISQILENLTGTIRQTELFLARNYLFVRVK